MRERVVYLDVVRVLACMMVIVQHSPMADVVNSVLLSASGFLTYPCCPLFFMVSGALLLPMASCSPEMFIRKRLSKVLWPTLVWTLLYFGVRIVKGDVISLTNVLSIPFSAQGCAIFWFMYVMIGLYLITPIISPWLKCASRKEIELFLILWGVTLLYSHIEGFLQITTEYENMLYYFGGYLGYFVLGYYLHHYVKVGEAKFSIVSLMLLGPIVLYGILKFLGVEFTFSAYTSILTASMATAWFLIIRLVCDRYTFSAEKFSYLVTISNLSFGIYLMHVMVMGVAWTICRWLGLVSLPQIIVTSVFTFTLSYVFSMIISRMPYSQYIIGYKHKK